jgi:hypothetical protein
VFRKKKSFWVARFHRFTSSRRIDPFFAVAGVRSADFLTPKMAASFGSCLSIRFSQIGFVLSVYGTLLCVFNNLVALFCNFLWPSRV